MHALIMVNTVEFSGKTDFFKTRIQIAKWFQEQLEVILKIVTPSF